MQPFHPERFEREMGCSEADWLRWLPEAIGDHPWSLSGRTASVHLGQPCGHHGNGQARVASTGLTLAWQSLPPLSIALLTLPRLRVSFWFEGVGEAGRQRFMRRFDLYLQRGGG